MQRNTTAELTPLWIEFFDELQNIRGRSLNTVAAYRRDLEIYLNYKKQNGITITGFYDFLRQQNLSVRSQARVISSLRTYFKFCEERGLQRPELKDLRPPKVNASLPKALQLDEFEILYKACQTQDQAKTYRNELTLLFLYGLGCRVTELIDLNILDYSPTDLTMKIKGKGGKERLVPLSTDLATKLNIYLQLHRLELMKEPSSAILINDRGRRPSRVDLWRWLAAWSIKAGFAEPINPHRFRHGCATAMLEGGADLRSIQLLLGHASIQTTQIYTNVSTASMTEAIQKHHPFSNLE
ncbi:MAG: tyrosine-type recombinase/integrase [Pseudobdellovibrionaceae bacterium]